MAQDFITTVTQPTPCRGFACILTEFYPVEDFSLDNDVMCSPCYVQMLFGFKKEKKSSCIFFSPFVKIWMMFTNSLS